MTFFFFFFMTLMERVCWVVNIVWNKQCSLSANGNCLIILFLTIIWYHVLINRHHCRCPSPSRLVFMLHHQLALFLSFLSNIISLPSHSSGSEQGWMLCFQLPLTCITSLTTGMSSVTECDVSRNKQH